MSDPVLEPYDCWFYAIEHGGDSDKTEIGGAPLLAFPTPAHFGWARQRNPNLVAYVMDDLLEIGRTPIMAAIGLPKDHDDYQAVRREWIGVAIESLLADIKHAIETRGVFPGEPFQNVLHLEGNVYFINIDTIDGITLASATGAGTHQMNRLCYEINEIAGVRLTDALRRLHQAAERV